MVDSAKRNPDAPGVLRGTALYKCETRRYDREEPASTKVDYKTQKFDANIWSDSVNKSGFRDKVSAYLNILGGNCTLDDISMEDQREPGKNYYTSQPNAQALQECKDAFNPKPNPSEGLFASLLSACGRAFTRVACAMQYSDTRAVASAQPAVNNNRVGDHIPSCRGTACYR